MNLLCSVLFVISTLYVHKVLSNLLDHGNYFTLYGQVINPTGSLSFIERGSRLIVQLVDISVADGLTATITQKTSRAVVFPVSFNISYRSTRIKHRNLHVLNAKIINKYYKLLFTNERHIEVKLLGIGRTRYIDVPVVSVKRSNPVRIVKYREWPELVGMNGDDAVNIIKRETGYQLVFIVKQGTQVIKDLRYDRVCVFVDKNGKVSHVPSTG